MNYSITDIEILIAKSLSGNISFKEQNQLDTLRSSATDIESLYHKSVKAWEKSEKYIDEKELKTDLLKIQTKINQQLQIKLRKIKRRNLIFKFAAAILLPLTITISWYLINSQKNTQLQEQYTEIASPKGNVSKCILPDGTEVWINTASSITYNTVSFNQENREINLSGEAYFHVASDIDKPFKVTTELGCVCVTGTQFNVKAYHKTAIFETVLTEGSVTLNFYANSQQEIELVPGERAIYDSNKNEVFISKVDSQMHSSWRNGKIIFKDATLNDLIKELERIYDIRFYLEDEKLGDYRFRGMFSYNNNLIDALEKIKKTAHLDYNITNKEVKLKKNN